MTYRARCQPCQLPAQPRSILTTAAKRTDALQLGKNSPYLIPCPPISHAFRPFLFSDYKPVLVAKSDLSLTIFGLCPMGSPDSHAFPVTIHDRSVFLSDQSAGPTRSQRAVACTTQLMCIMVQIWKRRLGVFAGWAYSLSSFLDRWRFWAMVRAGVAVVGVKYMNSI